MQNIPHQQNIPLNQLQHQPPVNYTAYPVTNAALPLQEVPNKHPVAVNLTDMNSNTRSSATVESEETLLQTFQPVEPKSIFAPGKQFVSKPLRKNNTVATAVSGSSSNGIPTATFFFSNRLIDNSFLDLVTSIFLPVRVVIESSNAFSESNPGEITVSKGDKLTVNEHLLDGWCVGKNISKSTEGKFPLECVSPNAEVQLHFIYCYTSDSQESFILPDLVEYVQKNFVKSITVHHINTEDLQESALYPVFGTLTGDERCLVHGSVEFKEFMFKFLDDFGEGFWKKLDIKKL
ncbi:hypothetical protein BC833DRAFT_622711 [Globomyces pollinis-pini]|nr:hypothetical protein BC833DRAFT_622711 [Globomyces pollinis-pini]